MIEPVLGLMLHSEAHREYSVDEIVRCIIPPIQIGQHQGLVVDGRLVAWMSWAFMTTEGRDAFLADELKMVPPLWRSGPEFVVMDIIAPFGHVRPLVRMVRNALPDDIDVSAVRFPRGGKRVKVKHKRFGNE